jgi:hypothetical protein
MSITIRDAVHGDEPHIVELIWELCFYKSHGLWMKHCF